VSFPSFDQVDIWNKTQGAQDQHAHDMYVAAAAQWKIQNTDNRANGRPLSQVPVMPIRTIFYYDEQGAIQSKHVPFDDLKVPTLDPLPPPPPPGPGPGGIGTVGTTDSDKIAMTLNLVTQIYTIISTPPPSK
jgi:hypothetical protein